MPSLLLALLLQPPAWTHKELDVLPALALRLHKVTTDPKGASIVFDYELTNLSANEIQTDEIVLHHKLLFYVCYISGSIPFHFDRADPDMLREFAPMPITLRHKESRRLTHTFFDCKLVNYDPKQRNPFALTTNTPECVYSTLYLLDLKDTKTGRDVRYRVEGHGTVAFEIKR
jgi:hypothetical protein